MYIGAVFIRLLDDLAIFTECICAGALVQWLKLPAWKVGDRRFEPTLAFSMKQNVSSLLTRKDKNIVGSLRDREVASSVLDRQGSNFESCVWRAVSSHSSRHPQEVLLARCSLYMCTKMA